MGKGIMKSVPFGKKERNAGNRKKLWLDCWQELWQW